MPGSGRFYDRVSGGDRVRHPFLKWRWLLALPPLFFLGLFFFYPLIRICALSLTAEGHGGIGAVVRFARGPLLASTLWFTLWQAAVSTIITLFLGIPAAWVFGRVHFRGKRLFQALTAIPFVLPTVVVAAAFRALLGARGMVNEILTGLFAFSEPPLRIDRTVWFFLLAHVFYNTALVTRIVGGFWAGLDRRIEEAARVLGASPAACFFRVTLPLLLPSMGSAALLVFIFCFTSFGIILLLGGPGYATLEVEIYRQAVQLFNLPVAAALSLFQMVFCFLLMALQARISRRSAVAFHPMGGAGAGKKPEGAFEKTLTAGILAFMTLLLGAPLAALVARSFTTDTGFSIVYYTALFREATGSLFYVPPVAAVVNSVAFALAAMVMAVFLGGAAAAFLARPGVRGVGWLDALFMLPLAASAVTLGFGFIISFNRGLLNLRDSVMLVPTAHTLVAFPFVVRCLLPSLRRIPESLREAATLLGAAPFKVWRSVDLPLCGRALSAGAVFAFSVSMGEFGASAFVARPQRPTLPVAIFRFLGQPGEMNFGQAMAMSVILMAVTAVGFVLLEKWQVRSLGEF